MVDEKAKIENSFLPWLSSYKFSIVSKSTSKIEVTTHFSKNSEAV